MADEQQDRFVWRVNAHRQGVSGKKERVAVEITTFNPGKAKELFRKTQDDTWTIDAVEKLRKVAATEPMRGKVNLHAETGND